MLRLCVCARAGGPLVAPFARHRRDPARRRQVHYAQCRRILLYPARRVARANLLLPVLRLELRRAKILHASRRKKHISRSRGERRVIHYSGTRERVIFYLAWVPLLTSLRRDVN